MPWTIYEFIDGRGNGIIETWLQRERIHITTIARLNQKIDLLARVGPDLPPQLLASLGNDIFKLKVMGRGRQLRPMLCPGPLNHDFEYTLLFGCIEIGGELSPNDGKQRAIDNREIIVADPTRRRLHEYHF
jgi:hypothetical protein